MQFAANYLNTTNFNVDDINGPLAGVGYTNEPKELTNKTNGPFVRQTISISIRRAVIASGMNL